MHDLRFCPRCGAPIRPGATFCANCGSSIGLTGTMQKVGEVPPYVAPMVKQWHERHALAGDNIKTATRTKRIVLYVLSLIALYIGVLFLPIIGSVYIREEVVHPILLPFLQIGVATFPLFFGFQGIKAAFGFKVTKNFAYIPIVTAVICAICLVLGIFLRMFELSDLLFFLVMAALAVAILGIEYDIRKTMLLRFQ